MKIVVRSDQSLKEEILSQGLMEDAQVDWVTDITIISAADAYIDLLFTPDSINEWKKMEAGVVIVNSVGRSLKSFGGNFIRINGWPSFLKRPVVEAACLDESLKLKGEQIFKCFNKTTEWVPDVPGFISARVVAMIINEAYFGLQENISTKEEIDVAMKLGTNYPYGPFEWAEKIGKEKVVELLNTLYKEFPRYEPCSLLIQEALNK